jgi:large subunit ribosomal protein L15
MKLNQISDKEGARKKRMRVGLGVGSGKGKTAGRGVKGQKARRGVAINGFEGGQMPIYMRLPKRGFTPFNAKSYAEVNIGRIEDAIKAGKLDAKKTIDAAALIASGVLRRSKDGVRLLAKGELKSKIELVVSGASKAAIEAVEKAGGKVTVTEPVAAKAAE